MASKALTEWRKLPVTLAELCIDTTLRCGQSFRWRKINDEWICALHGRILALKQDPKYVHYKITWPDTIPVVANSSIKQNGDAMDDTEELLRRYFALNVNLTALYEQWSAADANFRQKAPKFTGVRMLSQDAWEALICFICSSNNNIARISQMVHKLCQHYGPLIGYVDGEPIHDFPTPEALCTSDVESRLRELGFGYRARYIAETARVIVNDKPVGWLEGLRNPGYDVKVENGDGESIRPTYKAAHEELLTLSGVGPKVADCVCLMGLGWAESVPVDTHVWQIAQRDYKMGRAKTKTFNKVMYDAVGDLFRNIWGDYAGWAHSVLFTADLRAFSDKGVKQESIEEEEIKKEERSPAKKRTTANSNRNNGNITPVKKEEEVEDVKVSSLPSPGPAKRRRIK